MRVGVGGDTVLITYALGSCLGLAIYDPVTRVGGLLHAMLPSASLAPDKAVQNPAMFVDTGVPELFRACYRLGATKGFLQVVAAGCAHLSEPGTADVFQVGRRNMVMLRRLLRNNGVLLKRHDTSGRESRSLSLALNDGDVRVSVQGRQRKL
jgi:chemotaxis protein CheD